MVRIVVAILLLVGGFSAGAKPLRVLFLGNSLTFMPDWKNPVVPDFVEHLLKSQNREIIADKILHGGHTLENHWNLGEFQEKLANNRYDYVIIQAFSIEALNLPACFRNLGPWEPKPQAGPAGRPAFLEYGEKMIQMARANGAKPLVFQPWIYQEGHPWFEPGFQCSKFEGTNETWYGGSRAELQRRLSEGYQKLKNLMLDQHGYGLRILDIGGLWPQIPDSDLLFNIDHYHPTYYGSMLSALVIAEELTGIPAPLFRYTPEQLTDEQVKYLAQIAHDYHSLKIPSSLFEICQATLAGQQVVKAITYSTNH